MHAQLMTVERPGIKGNSAGGGETTEVVPLRIEQDLNGVGTSRYIERKHTDTRVRLVSCLPGLELWGIGGANGVEFLESDARRGVQDLHFKRLASELKGRIGTVDGDRSIGVHSPGNGRLNVGDLVLEQDLASTINEADTSLDAPRKAISSASSGFVSIHVRSVCRSKVSHKVSS